MNIPESRESLNQPPLTICFIPCCKRKKPGANAVNPGNPPWYNMLATQSRQDLLNGRATVIPLINRNQNIQRSALELYDGCLYRALNKTALNTNLRIFIVSAGYGLVESSELIYGYDAVMKATIARSWQGSNLVNVISDTILSCKPTNVFGFFTGPQTWPGAHAKYRYFYEQGVTSARNALNNGGGGIHHAGCFYRSQGRGTTLILSTLGKCLMDLVVANQNNTLPAFFRRVYNNNYTNGNVVIGYQCL